MVRFALQYHRSASLMYVFHIIDPDPMKLSIQQEIVLMKPVEEWCEENFGQNTVDRRNARWVGSLGFVYFRDEVDAAAFRLRWC